ncbi:MULTISPECIES: glycoside hydrolase family 36 protein [Megamonas]|uniref:Alpha-galactosidase n=1 Tax=Megamonas rupellensis TaxID=491921 RepID=A0A411ZTK3_9FIRM|nr:MULTISPECIES: glycoside hydrolase family 36 protein [Megamonas]RGO05718.1 alpha-galactosidase [Megamonas rupellensis]RGQ06152.1 alpha-galactosidase [Megamonas rupellensis]
MLKNILKINRPDFIELTTETKTVTSKWKNDDYNLDDINVNLNQDNEHLAIFLTAQTSKVKWIKLRWNNLSWDKNVRFLGDAWERGYGDMEWKGMNPNRFMPWYFCAKSEAKSICYGVKVRPSAMCFWQVDSLGMTLFLDVRCGGSGVNLKGRVIKLADVIACEMRDCTSFEAMQEFCGQMCEDPILPKYSVYGSNNWYYAYGKSSESEILADCDYILNLTKDIENKPYMVIDDCWQEHHRLNEYNGGPWTKGNEKFPDMKALAEKLVQKGVRPGIWVRLLLNEDENIKNEWRLSHNNCIDPTNPEALNYIKEDIKRICNWGYTLIKHDFSTFDLFGKWGFQMSPLVTDDGWHFYDDSLTSAEVVKLLYKAILDASVEASNGETLILGCNTIGHLGAGYMHINRTGDDTSGVIWERTRFMGVNTLAFRLPQHGKFYEIDADCVGIDGGISWSMNKQWADVLAKSGTPLFISVRPNILDETEKQELHEILKVASKQEHHVIPVDWEETTCPEHWQDKDHDIDCKYQWFEETGLKFNPNTIRYQTFLAMVE